MAHTKLALPWLVDFLIRAVWDKSACGRIFSGSPGTFRRRFQQLLRAVAGRPNLILPSSLRPGGATYYYQIWDGDVARLQWMGRWASPVMLRHYIQELGAVQILHRLPDETKKKINKLEALFDDILKEPVAEDLGQGVAQNLTALLV